MTTISFANNNPDGRVSAIFNCGFGEGNGMSYQLNAFFKDRTRIESLTVGHTDPWGIR